MRCVWSGCRSTCALRRTPKAAASRRWSLAPLSRMRCAGTSPSTASSTTSTRWVLCVWVSCGRRVRCVWVSCARWVLRERWSRAFWMLHKPVGPCLVPEARRVQYCGQPARLAAAARAGAGGFAHLPDPRSQPIPVLPGPSGCFASGLGCYGCRAGRGLLLLHDAVQFARPLGCMLKSEQCREDQQGPCARMTP